MPTFSHRFLALGLVLAGAACSGSSGSLPQSGAALSLTADKASGGPPACKGQTTTTLFATSKTTKFAGRAAPLCVPAFGGFGGAIEFPAAKPAVPVTLTTSTTNYNQMLPPLKKKGKPLFYLQFVTTAATVFKSKIVSDAGLTSKTIVTGKSYSVYGEAKLGGVAGITIPFTPCTAKATSGTYGGVIGGIGSLLASQNISGAGTIYIEIYRGGGLSTICGPVVL